MSDGDVDVWVADLDGIATEPERLSGMLDRSEVERAARFRSAVDRRRFTAKHAIRRLVLARYLEHPPREIGFRDAGGRKPEVTGLSSERLDFNDSASGRLAVYAVARGLRVGVDIEQIRSVRDAAEIVERLGSPVEAAAYRLLPEPDRDTAFLRWWTAKEAFVKAIGSGLDHALNRFSVSFPSPEGIRLLDVDGDRDEAARFWLGELTPAAGYAGALVAEGRPRRVRQRRWSLDGQLRDRGAA